MEQSRALKGRKEPMARMLARIPVHFVFSTTEPGTLAPAPLQGWPCGFRQPRVSLRFTLGYDPCGASRLVMGAANSPGDSGAYRATSHAKCSSSGAISFSQARRTAAGDPGVEMTTFPP